MDLTGEAGPGMVDTAGGNIGLSGILSGPGGLVKVGSGWLILSGRDSYTGGTIVDAGTLVATSGTALPDGTSLTVGTGGTFIFDPSVASLPAGNATVSAASAVAAVPEPGTLVLLLVGLVLGVGIALGKQSAG